MILLNSDLGFGDGCRWQNNLYDMTCEILSHREVIIDSPQHIEINVPIIIVVSLLGFPSEHFQTEASMN